MNVVEITVQRCVGDLTPVVVEYMQGDGMRVRREGRLELIEEALNAQITHLDYGRALGEALFRDDVLSAFTRSLPKDDERLHVLLEVEDDKLRRWHWERLCAPIDGDWDFLSLNQRTPFSLYLPSVTDRRFPPIGRRDLRVLIIAASPADLEKRFRLKAFDVGNAVAGVRAGLGEIPHAVLADVTKVPGATSPPTLDALAERITAEPVTLLHFICHGQVAENGETVIYLADAQNRGVPVSASQLIERLRRLQGARGLPHFAFLATCESAAPEAEGALGGLGQRLVRDLGMPAVLAMTERVSVATADALAAAFYPRLREHGLPDLALAEATAGLAGRHDITVPALYSRLAGRPLFSDALDWKLTPAEVDFGLRRLAELLPAQAPILAEGFEKAAGRLRATLQADQAALSREAQKERTDALAAINSLGTEVLDLSFNALALGQEPPPYDARCPFQGLTAFDYERRAFFFGREKLVDVLKGRLAEHNFLAVLGPSGSGKSSLVMAGLVPALEARHPGLRWSVMRPGRDPLHELDLALSSLATAPISSAAADDDSYNSPSSTHNTQHVIRNTSSFLIVDQFEELFTLTDDDARQAFIDRLLALSQRHYVVLTLRADFWGDCAPYPALKAEMQAHQELIPPMTAAELRSAMEQQARVVDLRFEADLANTILDDVVDEPGAMPLLQHALLELWKRRHGRWLRPEEYRNLGGVRQAIARTADGIYDAAPSTSQRRMRDIFLRLTRLDEDAVAGTERRDTRRRVLFVDLVPAGVDPEPTRLLVNELADARLVVTGVNAASGQDEVEIAHEALIRYWGQLQRWLDEDRYALRLLQNISQDAHVWDAAGREEAQLPRWNARLQEALVLSRRSDLVLSNLERDYLKAATDLHDRESAAEHKRQQDRFRLIAGAAAIALVLALLAGVFGVQSKRNADTASIREIEAREAKATSVSNAATAEAASTEAVSERNVALAASTAEARQKAMAEAASVVARENEARAWTELARQQLQVDPVASLYWSSRALPTASDHRPYVPQAELVFRQALQTSLERKYITVSATLADIQVSVDGPDIAIGGDALTWVAHDLGTQNRPTGSDGKVAAVEWGADGRLLSYANSTVDVWQSQRLIASRDFGDAITCALWRPGSPEIAVCAGTSLLLWSPLDDSVSPIRAFKRSLVGRTPNIRWSPSGTRLAAWDSGGDLLIWDPQTRQDALFEPPTRSTLIWDADWSPNEEYLTTIAADTTARIWKMGAKASLAREMSASEVQTDTLTTTGVRFVDNDRLATWVAEGKVGLWSVGGETGRTFDPKSGTLREISLAPDKGGKRLLVFMDDGSFYLWNLDTDARTVFRGHSEGVVAADWRGDTLATGSMDGTARIWDTVNGKELAVLRGHTQGDVSGRADVFLVQWQEDGQLLTAGQDGSLRMWQVFDAGGLPLCFPADRSDQPPTCYAHTHSIDSKSSRIQSARWLDNDRILWTGNDGIGRRLQVSTGRLQELPTPDPSQRRQRAAWSPDGSRVLTFPGIGSPGRGQPEAEVWDLETGISANRISSWITSTYWVSASILAGQDGVPARLVDPRTGAIQGVLKEQTTGISDVQVFGDRFATAGQDGVIRVWRTDAGALLWQSDISSKLPVQYLQWNKDGKLLLSVGAEVTLWDLEKKKRLWSSKETGLSMGRAVFSPDERYVAAPSGDTMYVWNAQDGKLEWSQHAHGSAFHGVQWVSGSRWDGQGTRPLLLAWGGDGATGLWDGEKGDQIMRIPDATSINIAAASPDGARIFTASDDGLLRIWDAWINAPEELMTTAQASITRKVGE